MNKLTLIHVDDENESLNAFKKIAEASNEIAYMGGFNTVDEASKFIAKNSLDLIVLDVEMPGKNGFALAEQIKEIPTQIVFLTSHAQYALHAFEACALDYLLKPINEEALDQLLKRFRLRKNKFNDVQTEQINELYSNLLLNNIPKRIFLSTLRQIYVIQLDEVLYFEANENYTFVYLKNGIKHIASRRFKTYYDVLLNHPDFVRIHRSFLVNKNYVVSILRDGRKSKFSAVLTNGVELEISLKKSEDIIKKLQ